MESQPAVGASLAARAARGARGEARYGRAVLPREGSRAGNIAWRGAVALARGGWLRSGLGQPGRGTVHTRSVRSGAAGLASGAGEHEADAGSPQEAQWNGGGGGAHQPSGALGRAGHAGAQPDEGGAAGRGGPGSGDVGERADGVRSRAVTGSGETDPATREPRWLVSLGGANQLGPRDPHRVMSDVRGDERMGNVSAEKCGSRARRGRG